LFQIDACGIRAFAHLHPVSTARMWNASKH
jgi:hypothetical protein